jgi:hypothetical protein
MNARRDGWVGQGETTPSITTKRWHVVDVMVHRTTNDYETEIDNCGADGCEVVEAEKKNDGFSILLINTSIEDVSKKEHVPSMERTALENKVWQEVEECVPRIPSESRVVC